MLLPRRKKSTKIMPRQSDGGPGGELLTALSLGGKADRGAKKENLDDRNVALGITRHAKYLGSVS